MIKKRFKRAKFNKQDRVRIINGEDKTFTVEDVKYMDGEHWYGLSGLKMYFTEPELSKV